MAGKHPTQLINLILIKLACDYPPADGWKFVIEKILIGSNLRIFPDIQVLSPAGKLKCVVEIGYTRPEKLHLYLSLGVDTRWYDKKGQRFYPWAHGEKTLIEHIERPPRTHLRWRCYNFGCRGFCQNCWQEEYDCFDDAVRDGPLGEIEFFTNDMRGFAWVSCLNCAERWCLCPGELMGLFCDIGIVSLDHFMNSRRRFLAGEYDHFDAIGDYVPLEQDGVALTYAMLPKMDRIFLE